MSDYVKRITFVPFDVLPEAREWKVGKVYRTKMVLKQVGMDENGANFEVIDATSLETRDIHKRYYLSDSGSYCG